jgi:ATP-dependent DNA ligase
MGWTPTNVCPKVMGRGGVRVQFTVGLKPTLPQPLSDRRARFQTLLADDGPGDAARIRFCRDLETGGVAVLKSAYWLALEGVVSKRLDAPYRSGRTNSWTKAK